jgi:hypothetical protein
LERLKHGKYNKPHWLRYIRTHEPPGPTEEEEEELSSLRFFAVSLSSSKFLDIVPNARNASFHIFFYSFYHKTVQARVCVNNNIVKNNRRRKKEC